MLMCLTRDSKIQRNQFISDCLMLLKDGGHKEKVMALDNKLIKRKVDCHHIKKNSYLSSQEHQVIRLLLTGLKYREIATELKLSSRTVEFYIENIKKKFDCKKKKQLIELFANRL